MLDNVLHVFIAHIGERDKIALEEAQTVIVVANVECIAPSFGKHCHETKDAGIYACAHFVKDRPIKLQAPVLARESFELNGGEGPIAWIEDFEGHSLFVRLPKPDDHIGKRLAIDGYDAHSRLNPHVVGRRILAHSSYQCALSGLRIA